MLTDKDGLCSGERTVWRHTNEQGQVIFKESSVQFTIQKIRMEKVGLNQVVEGL